MGTDGVEHTNVEGGADEKVRENVDGGENEIVIDSMGDVVCEGADGCEMKGGEV